MKLTKWYPPGVKPVRKGIYQTSLYHPSQRELGWCYWSGKHWGFQYSQFEHCKQWGMTGDKATIQTKHWRGCKEEQA